MKVLVTPVFKMGSERAKVRHLDILGRNVAILVNF